jgi:hypothetical protein
MKRVGVLFIVLAAAVTIACGGGDSAGSSPTSPSSTTPGQSTSQPTNPSTLNAPTNLTVAANGGVVTLSWTGVSGANEYLVLVGTTSGNSDKLFTNTTKTDYTWTVGSGRYYARVQAKNGNVTSGSSNEVTFAID